MIFGTDGIRGFAGNDLSAFKALKAAMAIGIFFKNKALTKKVIVGKDTRRSGYMIENAIVSGLNAVGFNVLQIGPMPTPAVAFLSQDLRCDFAIMISASHNPYYDNGIKVFDANGFKLSESEEFEIDRIFNDDNLINSHLVIKDKIGSAKRIDDVIGRYIVHIKNSFPKDTTLKNLRIVLDCANGAAYKVAPAVFSELGADVITLACEPNGININDNCGALHPNMLAKEVKRLRADVGFAFDGDADRLVVVDENGEIINGDILLGVLAKALKDNNNLSGVAISKMSNMGFLNYLKKHDISYVTTDVGDKYILHAMQDKNYNFGGEQSGHIIFSDYAKTGDGIVAALQVAKLLLNKKASEIFSEIKLFPQSLTNLKITEKKPLDKLEGIDNLYEKLNKNNVNYLFRYSGTENLMRILLECESEKTLQNMENECIKYFQSVLV